MFKVTSLVLSLVLAQATVSYAATQSLLRLSNDRDAGVNVLGVQTDASGAIQKFVYATVDGEKSFTVAQVAAGAVLEAEQGINALTLSGKLSAGKLSIRHVYNGLTGEYRSCDMKIARNEKGTWGLINAYTNKPMQSAKLITWGLGITTLQGLCQK